MKEIFRNAIIFCALFFLGVVASNVLRSRHDTIDYGSPLTAYLSEHWMNEHPISKKYPEKIKENTKKAITHYINVMSDVRYVRVDKTIDTEEYVITLVDSRGGQASLWLDKNGYIESITPY